MTEFCNRDNYDENQTYDDEFEESSSVEEYDTDDYDDDNEDIYDEDCDNFYEIIIEYCDDCDKEYDMCICGQTYKIPKPINLTNLQCDCYRCVWRGEDKQCSQMYSTFDEMKMFLLNET